MLVAGETVDEVHQILRIGLCQFGSGHDVALAVARTVGAVGAEIVEAVLLLKLGIGLSLGNVGHVGGISGAVHLCVLEEVLCQFQRRVDVLIQSRDGDGGPIGTYADVAAASQSVEALLDLLGRERVCA